LAYFSYSESVAVLIEQRLLIQVLKLDLTSDDNILVSVQHFYEQVLIFWVISKTQI